ncbi:MAG: tetratricopeptide repeat-containing glycosyltransferase, partial [Flavobacteriales bacterium]
SSDDTIEKIKELGGQHNIKGEVFSEPWIDFAHNRNIALKKAFDLYNNGTHQCNWLLIIDADEALNPLPENFIAQPDKSLSYQGYQLYNDILSKQLLLLNTQQQKWIWEGKIHNYLVNNENYPIDFSAHVIRNALHFTGAKSHEFNNTQEKSARDASMLINELNEENLTPKNTHRFFELGNELFESKNHEKAIEAYSKIIHSDSVLNEIKYLSLLQIAHIYFEFLIDLNKAEKLYSEALNLQPERKEAYYYLAKLFQKKQESDKILPLLLKAHDIPKSNLNKGYYLVDYGIYSWKIEMELATALFKTKNTKDFNVLYESIVKQQKMPNNKLGIIDSMKKILNK